MTAKKKPVRRKPARKPRQLGAVKPERLMVPLPPLPARLRGPDRFMGIGLSVADLADSATHSLAAAYCTREGHKYMKEGIWTCPCPDCQHWAVEVIHTVLEAGQLRWLNVREALKTKGRK